MDTNQAKTECDGKIRKFNRLLRRYEPNNYGELDVARTNAEWTREVATALDDMVDSIECLIISHGPTLGSAEVADWNERINTSERKFQDFVTKVGAKINSESQSQNENTSTRSLPSVQRNGQASQKDSHAVRVPQADVKVDVIARDVVKEAKADDSANLDIKQLKIPDLAGGEAHVLLGTLYETCHQVQVHSLPSGLLVVKLRLVSHGNLYAAVQFAQKLSVDEFEDSTGVMMFYEEDVSENETDHEDVSAEVNDSAEEIIEEDPGKILSLTKLDSDEDHHDVRKQSLEMLKTVEVAEVNLDTGQDYHEGDACREHYASIDDASKDDATRDDAARDDSARDDASRDDAADILNEELETEAVGFSNA